MKQSVFPLVLAIFFGVQPLTALGADPLPAKVLYLSGGIGEEELKHVLEMRDDFNLRLLFCEVKGAYIAGVNVLVTDDKDRVVLAVDDAGPYLFAELPPGQYRVKATYAGHVKEQRLHLPSNAAREGVFRW